MSTELQLVTFSEGGRRTMQDSIAPGDVVDAIRSVGDDDWFWLDITGPAELILDELTKLFGFDRVRREDLIEDQSPRFDEHDDVHLIVVHALAPDDQMLRTTEIDMLLGDRWLLTVHAEESISIDHVQQRALAARFQADSPVHLCARLIEFVGERYLPMLDLIDEQIFELEDGALSGDPNVLADVHALRRDIALLHRTLAPQRRMLEIMITRSIVRVGPSARELGDALDHHVQLVDALDSAHALVVGLVDSYRSASSERMNETMRTLTVFAAIFMPLTLIAGVYGMNFDHMPELHTRWGYFAVLAAMALVGVGLWLHFVRRGFIGGPRLSHFTQPARAAGRVGRGLASAATTPIRIPARMITSTRKDRTGSDPQ